MQGRRGRKWVCACRSSLHRDGGDVPATGPRAPRFPSSSNRQMHPGLQEALAASPNGAGLHGRPASSRCWCYLSPRSALFSRTDITAHFHVEIFGPGVSLLLL